METSQSKGMDKVTLEIVFREVVRAFRQYPDAEDEELFRKLIARGHEREIVARAIEFLPIAYVRLMFESRGVEFEGSYDRATPSQGTHTSLFTDDPIWHAAIEFARQETAEGLAAEAIIKVAGRSSELDAINQLLKRGTKMGNIVCGRTLLPWPKTGPK